MCYYIQGSFLDPSCCLLLFLLMTAIIFLVLVLVIRILYLYIQLCDLMISLFPDFYLFLLHSLEMTQVDFYIQEFGSSSGSTVSRNTYYIDKCKSGMKIKPQK